MRYSKIGYYALLCTALGFIGGCGDNLDDRPENPSVCDAKLTPCLIGYSCIDKVCLKNASAGEACGDGIYCIDNGTCTDGVCKAAQKDDGDDPNSGKIGSECTQNSQCKEGTCLNRICTDTAGTGESCSSLPCPSQHVCDDAAKICIKTVSIGEACGADAKCRIGECIGDVCTVMSEDDLLKTTDTDGDTIPDYWDRCDADTDGDGIVDCQDPDSDGDTIPDSVEGGMGREEEEPYDSDGNGIYDFLSADSDRNGIGDAAEGICEVQTDESGNVLTDEADGMPLVTETCKPYVHDGVIVRNIDNIPISDTNGDTIPDFQSPDNDGDGLRDEFEIAGYLLQKDGVSVPGRICGDAPCEAGTPENPWDSDGDTIPDYNDPDSDGDTIPDSKESLSDTDGDGNLDIYDTDSDGDTIPDSVEKDWTFTSPEGLVTHCVTSPDCDGDGLPDSIEYAIRCDPEIYVTATESPLFTRDADNDTYPDAAEYAAAKYAIEVNQSDTCLKDGNCITVIDPASTSTPPALMKISKPEDLMCDDYYGVEDVFDFYFELPKNGPEQDKVLNFRPSVSRLDLVINLDVTGSMQAEIDNIKAKLTGTIIPGTKARVSDSAFGISAFADFPVNLYTDKDKREDETAVRYGYPVDYSTFMADEPWKMLSAVTTNQSELTRAVQTYEKTDGFDYPESGYESLWQIAGADTVTAGKETQYAVMGIKDTRYGNGSITAWKKIGPVTPAAGRWGGAQFRTGSLPVVVHVTDAPSHNSTLAPSITGVAALKAYAYNASYIKNSHTDADVHKLYQDKGVRLISVYRRSGKDANDNNDREGIAAGAQHPALLNSSSVTNAVVPVCAFKKDDNSWTCGENRCCTVTTPAGSVAPDNGNCALSYGIKGAESLTDTLVAGIDALVKYGTNDVAARVIGESIAGTDKTTACFVKRVEAKQYVAPPQEPENSCNPKATAKKFADENGTTPAYDNGFTNFAAGTSSASRQGAQLDFTVVAQNDGCVEPSETAQTFSAQIELYNPTTQLSLGKREVYIIVPGEVTVNVVN